MVPTTSEAVEQPAGAGATEASAAEDHDDVSDAVASVLPGARKRLSPEQEKQIRAQVSRLPPESRKALEEWVNMKDDNKWALLALNCLVVIFILGVFLLFSAYLIAAHSINVFDIQTWRNGTQTAENLLRQMRILSPRGGAARTVTAEL